MKLSRESNQNDHLNFATFYPRLIAGEYYITSQMMAYGSVLSINTSGFRLLELYFTTYGEVLRTNDAPNLCFTSFINKYLMKLVTYDYDIVLRNLLLRISSSGNQKFLCGRCYGSHQNTSLLLSLLLV